MLAAKQITSFATESLFTSAVRQTEGVKPAHVPHCPVTVRASSFKKHHKAGKFIVIRPERARSN